jgi:4-amino-4-deoxy-L-arabinose transferase-like glycosyltransferase
LAIHYGFFLYDLHTNFAPFLRADRALQRTNAIASLLDAGTWREIHHALITNNLIIGEYIVQAALYHVGGAFAIVVSQIVLQLFAVLAVFRIALLTLNSSGVSFAAALVYASLPHSLVFPHQLYSEAIAVPVMVIGYWLFFEYRVGGKSLGYLLSAGAMLGLSACARPQLLLLPVVLMSFAMRNRSRRATGGAMSFVSLGLLPVVLWVTLVSSGTRRLSLGNAESSLGYNLYLRVLRISRSAPPFEGATITDRYLLGSVGSACAAELRNYFENPRGIWGPGSACTLSLPKYISFVVHYPGANFRQFLRDIFTLATKSGMSKLTIDYFDRSSRDRIAVQSFRYGWRTIWESKGLVAAIRSVAAVSPVIVIAELAGAVGFSALFIGFVLGLIGAARKAFDNGTPGEPRVGLMVLGLHALYGLATPLLSDAAQSRVRNPAEFAMCIIAALGAARTFAFYHERRRAAKA